MKRLFCLMVFAPFVGIAFAQTSTGASSVISPTLLQPGPSILNAKSGSSTTGGIQWTEGLSWQEVKEKAKQEHKYIFMDCYTTWCGPCKMMDNEVYTNDDVGDFFNPRFVSVKVQMDKTKKDNQFIQSWYIDADAINKQYHVEMYPTFLFFSPNAEIIHKEAGARSDIKNFISIAEAALKPGTIYNDPYDEYEKLVANHKRGQIKYDRLPEMVKIAKKLGDTAMSRQLVRLHEDYVSALTPDKRYTKENIEFWATLNLTSERKMVQFFFKDGHIIDKVMNNKGYSKGQVNRCIQNFIVTPFLEQQNKNPVSMSGMVLTGSNLKAYFNEADWKQLERVIHHEFNASYAKRNVLQAKVIWYERNRNWDAFAKTSFIILKKYPPDFSRWMEVSHINHIGWMVFEHVQDKSLINEGIKWVEKLVQNYKASDWFDTYANLLYKVGRKEDAILWQEKAVNLSPNDKVFQIALDQMKIGKPTYGVKMIKNE